MRHTLLGIALCLALGCGASDTVTLGNGSTPLRLTRVVLYQNGLAHYHRRGHVEERSFDLRVPATQVDDVLRSLTIVDGGGATLTGVRMLPSQAGEDVTLRVGLSTPGARDLRVSYVTEAPGFRPTYRLVVAEEGVHLQGLAMVDNPSSEDWSDVALALSTEVPLSFRYELRSTVPQSRPHFAANGRLLREELQAPALTDAYVPVNPAASGNINAAYGMAQVAQPEVSTRAGQRVGDEPEAAPATNGAGDAMLEFEQRPQEGGGEFAAVDGFDLGHRESGLVPFVDSATTGELALVFKPSPGGALSAAHPYRSVLFRNPSNAALLTGPVAIYDGARYAGDGVTAAIPAHAYAFVPYAIERSVRVAQNDDNVEDEVRATALAGGLLSVELRAVHRSRFTLERTTAIDSPAYVFVPKQDGYEARSVPDGTIATAQGWFVEATFDHDHAEITFDQFRRSTMSVNIAASPDHPYAAALLALLDGHGDVARLREILDRLAVIRDELGRVGEDLEVERTALLERREALDALRTVASGGSVRARLAQAVAQGVGRVDDLARRSTELHAEEIALGQEWYGSLRSLTVAAQ